MPSAGDGALRVVRDGDGRPSLQIARDVILLHESEGSTLRLYGFDPIGLTIGRFQDPCLFTHVEQRHELVRRPTGGGAIWHDADLTYALTMDVDESRSPQSYVDLLHDALVRALSRVGVRASRTEAFGAHPGPRAIDAAWCFARPCRGDVLAPDGRKLCGSAQRRLRAPRPRMLQHGSLVMRASPLTPFCAAVDEQTQAPGIRDALCEAISAEFADALSLTAVDGALLPGELERAAQVRESLAIPTLTP